VTADVGAVVRDTGRLRYRVGTAVVGLPVLLLAVWFGGLILASVAVVVAILAAIELRRLLPGPGGPLLAISVVGASVLIFTSAVGTPLWPHFATGSAAVGLLSWVTFHRGERESMPTLSRVLKAIGPLYPAAFLGLGLGIHMLVFGPEIGAVDAGRNWLLFSLLLVFTSDTFAFFTGRAIGSRRLAPRISPRKTWEGAIGALVGSASTSAVLSPLLPLQSDHLLGLTAAGEVMAFGVIGAGVSVLAQGGDLFVSALKRAGGSKDAGELLPGHGGVMDRLDSILPVLPAVYYGLLWAS
jgi:phosphatidate cytidylyltransferase